MRLRVTSMFATLPLAAIALLASSLPAFAGGPTLNVGSAMGAAGATVQIPISITRNGELVTAVSNLIQYDNTKFTPGTCVAQAPFSQACPTGNDTGAATLNGKICSNFPPADDCSVDADCGMGNFCNVNSVVSLSLADCDNNDSPDPFVADGTFVLCPFTIIMGTAPGVYPFAQNVASWSNAAGTEFSTTGTLGSIEVLACTDTDGDTVCDPMDNCDYTANLNQLDQGGIGVGSPPDGIGDACQCGDVVGTDGRVTQTDAVAIIRAVALMPPTATLTRPALCDVGVTVGSCTQTDATAIIRAAALMPPTFTLSNTCPPANP